MGKHTKQLTRIQSLQASLVRAESRMHWAEKDRDKILNKLLVAQMYIKQLHKDIEKLNHDMEEWKKLSPVEKLYVKEKDYFRKLKVEIKSLNHIININKSNQNNITLQ